MSGNADKVQKGEYVCRHAEVSEQESTRTQF